jgi:hypothetical protein
VELLGWPQCHCTTFFVLGLLVQLVLWLVVLGNEMRIEQCGDGEGQHAIGLGSLAF